MSPRRHARLSETSPLSAAALPAADDVAAAAAALTAWFKVAARPLPWRTDRAAWGTRVSEPGPADAGLPRRDPYRTWIAEIMLQQTQVATVLGHYARWMERFPDLTTLAAASEEDVLAHWAGLGYYSRARNILRTARELVSGHGGRFPGSREALLRLQGIGEYTAGAIASLAFNLPEPILDGNLVRVFSRLYGLDFLPVDAAAKRFYWDLSRAWVGAREPALVNEGLMELGALVCTPRAPDCGACPLASACRARAASRQSAFPPLKARPAVKPLRGFALVLRRGTQVLVYRPPKGELLAGLLTFPILEVAGTHSIPALKQAWSKAFPGFPSPDFRPRSTTISHSITHHQIQLALAEAELPRDPDAWRWPDAYAWLDAGSVPGALVSSLPRKIWRSIGETVPRIGRSAPRSGGAGPVPAGAAPTAEAMGSASP